MGNNRATKTLDELLGAERLRHAPRARDAADARDDGRRASSRR